MSIAGPMFHGRDDRAWRSRRVDPDVALRPARRTTLATIKAQVIDIYWLLNRVAAPHNRSCGEWSDVPTAFIYPHLRRGDCSRARRNRLAGCPRPLANQHPWTRVASPG